MQKEDKLIKNLYGTENHFQVPNGYFDNLASSVMQHIPDGETKVVKMAVPSWRRHIVAISTAAASVVALMVFTFTSHQSAKLQPADLTANVEATSEYSSVDDVVDYAMLDTDDMYAYMSGVE